MRQTLLFFFASIIFFGCETDEFDAVFEVEALNYAMVNTPVYVWLDDVEFDENATLCLHGEDGVLPVQLEVTDDLRRRLWWVVNLDMGETGVYGLRVNDECPSDEYIWERITEESTRLFFADQPVFQYEHPVFDPDDIEGTKKPFHHVFEPDGNRLITKGPGGLYPHHRGIFFGYNHIYVGDSEERIDIWHAANGERSEHVEILEEYAGPVMGGHKLKIHWKDHDGNPFIEEIREVRVFAQPYGETLIDFHSVMHPVAESVRLEGDRQHAGVQFRAAQYVADNSELTRFIRPENWSHLDGGEEIEAPEMYDMPWNAMHFFMEGDSYTVAYLSHPENPEDAEMSERLYGRFGEYFQYHLTQANPLKVSYRFWVAEGEVPSVESIDLKYHSYANPPGVRVR